MAELQTKTMMTPGGQVVRFQIDPSVDTSEIEGVQQSIRDQYPAQPSQPKPLAPAASPTPAILPGAKPSSNLLETYPALGNRIGQAKAAGYSDPEIQKHIQGKMQTAFKAGYSQDEVKAYLGGAGPTTGQKLAAGPLGKAAEFGLGALSRLAPFPQVWDPKNWRAQPGETFEQAQERGKGMVGDVMPRAASDLFSATSRTAGKYLPAGAEKTIEAIAAELPMHAPLTVPGAKGAKVEPKVAPGLEAKIPTPEAATAKVAVSPTAPPVEPVAATVQTTPGVAPKQAVKPAETMTQAAAAKAADALETKALKLFAQDLNKRPPNAKDLEAARAIWPKASEELKQVYIQKAAPKGKAAPKQAPAEMAPRTPEELGREAEQTRILQEGLEKEKPVGIPPGPITPEQQAMQARAFTPETPRGIPPVRLEVAPSIEAAKPDTSVTGRPEVLPQAKAPRPSRAKPAEELSLQGYLKREGGLPAKELPGEKKALGKQMPGLWRMKAPSLNEQAEKAHAAGFIPQPTTGALLEALEGKTPGAKGKSQFRDMESEIKTASNQAQRMEVESAASAMVDELGGTKEPLNYKGKTFEGAEAEKGGNLRLKDDPDEVLTKAEDILSVERGKTSGFPWENEGGAQQLTPAVKIGDQVYTGKTHAEIATQQAEVLKPENAGRLESGFVDADGKFVSEAQAKAPTFEKTEAGMQGVIPGAEGRSVPQKGLTGKKVQAEAPTELEQAGQPKPPEDTTLFGGIPLPAMKKFASDFVMTPLHNLRQAARTVYSPRRVSESAGEAQRLLTRRSGRIEEAERFVTEQFRYSRAFMDTVKPAEQLEFWHNLETGQKQGSPLMQKINDGLRAALDVNREELAKRGLLKTIIDDYAPHQFDRPQVAKQVMQQIEARRTGNKDLLGPKYFLKQRTLPGTVKEILESPEAQQAGLKLRYPNPVTAVEKLLFDSSRLIHGHDLLKEELIPRKYVQLFKDPRSVPPNWQEVEGYKAPRRPVTDVNRPDAPAVYVPTGKYYAPDPVARILNNYTRPGLLSTDRAYVKPLQWLREATGLMNLSNLGLSSFHIMTTATNSFAGEVARGIMAVKEGRPIAAGKSFATASTYFGPIIRDVAQGKRLQKIANDPKMEVHFPESAKVIQQYVDSGGRIDNTRPFFSRYVDGWLKAMEDRSIVEGGHGAQAKALKVLLTGGTEGIMNQIVAPAKISAFSNRFKDFMEAHPGLSEPEMLRASNAIMDQVDDAFGLVNYDRWGVDRHIRDAAFLSLRAVGWTMGNLKILSGGMEDLARGKVTERSARFLGDVAGVAFTGALLNLALAGKLPDIDVRKPLESIYNLMNPESGGVNPDGTPARVGYAGIQRDWGHLLFNVVKPAYQGDPMGAIQGAAKFAIGKESPVLGLGTKLATGKDYFGREIVKRSGGTASQLKDLAVGMGKEMLPFSVTNMMAERKQGIQRPWWQSGALGMTPPMSTKATESKFERLLGESMQRQGQLSGAQQEHVEFKKDLYEKLAKKESVTDLLQAGKVTIADVKEGMKRLSLQRQPQGQLRYQLSRPGLTLSTLAELAPTVTAEEAPLVLKTLDQKFVNSVNAGRVTKESKKMYDLAKKQLRETMQSKTTAAPQPLVSEPGL